MIVSRKLWATGSLALVAVAMMAMRVPAYGQSVAFSEAQNKNIPYNRSVTLDGKLSEIQVNSSSLTDVITVTGVEVTVDGEDPSRGDFSASDDTWSVSVGPFQESTEHRVTVRFLGNLKSASTALSAVINDQRYLAASEAFEAGAIGKSSSLQIAQSQIFGDTTANIINEHLISIGLEVAGSALTQERSYTDCSSERGQPNQQLAEGGSTIRLVCQCPHEPGD